MSFVKRIPAQEGSMGAILGDYPEMAEPVLGLTQHVMRDAKASLGVAERELIAAYVCGVNGCAYCYDTHRATAEALGIESDLLGSLLEDIDSAAIDEKLKPVLHFVKKLTQTPAEMNQADADALFDAGWDEQVYHYVVSICALFNCFTRLLEGYGIDNSPEHKLRHGRALAQTGYLQAAGNPGRNRQ